MSENIEFKQRIMKVFKCEVGCNYAAARLVRRVLNGCKIIYVVLFRYDDYTSGMLPCRAFYSHHSAYKTVLLRFCQVYTLTLQKILKKTEACFFL